ncbi:FprA family A-type flavoprotein [Methanobrevibacter curvatus]|uniref:Nitric oxide reductase n=1 Tax=Methanobrevibacter curvatus TaxID=49547 RepID=A0A166A3I2_9EURY|nr:FprA family A-type flavoprotein [Methanobrevibacter curvatus]KZX11518.1 nitric oxide reductase [Methanobrevibacter curvatus]
MKADAIKIVDGVYWVGVIDWDIRDYHGYNLDGTTYNTYLIFSEDKVTLIDNVFPGFFPQSWGRIEDAFKKEGKNEVKIDVVIQNHVENDHSGTLIDIIKKFPEVEVYCSTRAVNGLKNYFPSLKDFNFNLVKTGDSIEVGGKTFSFIDAPMLHWPDSMFTFLNDDGILFSNDAFGQHLCRSSRLDTDIDEFEILHAAQKFYANLITPSSKMVLMKVDELNKLCLTDKIKLIAPSHGQIWTNPEKIISKYSSWASGEVKDKITFIYDTMHHSTQKMAHALAEGVMSEGFEVRTYFLHYDQRSDAATDVLDSKAVVIGSPTMMNNPFPSLGDIIYYFNCLNFKATGYTKKAVVIGSKGWGGGAGKKLATDLEASGFEIFENYDILNIPHKDELDKCYEIGKELAKSLK